MSGPLAPLPGLVVHADWSLAPAKRWMATALLQPDGRYRVAAPEPVGPLDGWTDRMLARAPDGRVLAGFDFPIGLPAAYARRAGIAHFREALLAFGKGEWSAFYQIAERPDEVGLRRPFYPYRPGGTKRAHLTGGLGVPDFDALMRRCDRPTATRRAAGSLFWTMGAQQSGRAAIVGWRDLLAPALRQAPGRVRLWPFDGDLPSLLAAPGLVAAEVYPAEAALHLGLPAPGRGWSKRNPADRRAHADALLAWARRREVVLEREMRRQIRAGFGDEAGWRRPVRRSARPVGNAERGAGPPPPRRARHRHRAPGRRLDSGPRALTMPGAAGSMWRIAKRRQTAHAPRGQSAPGFD